MSERTFTIHDAAAASGLSRHHIAKMISQGRFRPMRGPRRGTHRPYTLRDIVHLSAIAALHGAGLSLARTVDITGLSAEGTAGRETLVHRQGEMEIVLDIAGIVTRVRDELGLT